MTDEKKCGKDCKCKKKKRISARAKHQKKQPAPDDIEPKR